MPSRSVRWLASFSAVLILQTGCDATGEAGADTTLASTNTTVPATTASTVDDWLTEPVMLDGRYFATSRGLDDDMQEEVDGQVEGVIEEGGELWTSSDGLTWMTAEEDDRPPPADRP